MRVPDAIVLDLDDTLFDTARLLVPQADARALAALRAAGLALDEDAARAALRALRASGAARPFVELARTHGVPTRDETVGEDAFQRFEVPAIRLDERVGRALDRLHAACPLALLTAGDVATQQAKVERLALRPWFTELVFVATDARDGKTPALRALLARRGWEPSRVVVVGDRPSTDVRAGNALGCRTVLVRAPHGEYAAQRVVEPHDVPWREIAHVAELPALLGF